MAKQKDTQKKSQQQQQAKGKEKMVLEEPVPAIVEGCLIRTGTRGEITQVKVRILQGKNKGKSMRRNVRGPIKKRDILILRETEIEARRAGKSHRGGK